jgi:hypothetical protein
MRVQSLLLGVVGVLGVCGVGGCFLSADGLGHSGALGDEGAYWFYLAGQAPAPIAAGGTKVGLAFEVRPGTGSKVQGVAGAIASATSSAPEVAALSCDDASCIVTSGVPGTATIVLSDSNGSKVDQITLTVMMPNRIELDDESAHGAAETSPSLVLAKWRDEGISIVAGVEVAVSFDLYRDDRLLLGNAGLSFGTTGSLHAVAAACSHSYDQVFAFTGDRGTGAISLDIGDTHSELPVTVLDTSSLTDVAIVGPIGGAGTPQRESLQAGERQVLGAYCTWAPVDGVTGIWSGSCKSTDSSDTAPREQFMLNAPPLLHVVWEAGSPAGTVELTCAFAGGPSTTLPVDVLRN